MLINNVSTERRASLIVKNSDFYIEIAKFVQAYTTIVKNPNEFLVEVGESPINKKTQQLKWEQLVKIMQTCDLGFATIPTNMDLVVYYNYALEIGSVDALDKKIATVDEVAEAQKHYYNFVDEAKTKAEEEYLKQKKMTDARQREIDYVDSKLAKIKALNAVIVLFMMFSVVIGGFGFVSFFVDNVIVRTVGGIFKIWNPNYIGGIIFIIIMFLAFAFFDSKYIKTKRDFMKLKQASTTIFARGDEMISKEVALKRKLEDITKDYFVVQSEINDKTKKHDVRHNIDVLKATNKYYKQLCEPEESYSESAERNAAKMNAEDDDFAPIKLSKEQEENMRTTKKSAISLAGQFDTEAYNAKFEKSRKSKNSKKEENQEQAEQEESEVTDEKKNEMKEQEEQWKKEQKQKELFDTMDYVNDILGINKPDNITKENQ